jgi:hypothetical protein
MKEVVFGHAYAIPAPCAVDDGPCGYDKTDESIGRWCLTR